MLRDGVPARCTVFQVRANLDRRGFVHQAVSKFRQAFFRKAFHI
jgi:hypothetical protein